MKVTYLSHSGFAVELPSATLVFDYYKGQIPDFSTDKPLFVFASHSHGDHFVPQVFDLANQYPQVRFIFSHDIWMTRKKHTRAGISEESFAAATYLRAHETRQFSLALDGCSRYDDDSTPTEENFLTITTLRSTDMGVAFLVECDGLRIYHAGDLHWWAWPGDTKQAAGNMTANYQREIAHLKELLTISVDTSSASPCLDVAFLPLDGRLEENYALGMEYFLEQIAVSHVFPMHFWDKYQVIASYLQNHDPDAVAHSSSKDKAISTVYAIHQEQQSWHL